MQRSCMDSLGVCNSSIFIRCNSHAIAGRSEFTFKEMVSFKWMENLVITCKASIHQSPHTDLQVMSRWSCCVTRINMYMHVSSICVEHLSVSQTPC